MPEEDKGRTTSGGGGNPTQPGMPMPTFAPRHHGMWARHTSQGQFTDHNHSIVDVYVNKKSSGYGSNAGYDFVTQVDDITTGPNAGQPWSNQIVWSSTFRLRYYSPQFNSWAVKEYPHFRKYNVTFNSGHVEEFEILIPGYYNSVDYLQSQGYTGGGGGVAMGAAPCSGGNWEPDFGFNCGAGGGGGTFAGGDGYQFTQINIDNNLYPGNPSGIWANGASYVNRIDFSDKLTSFYGSTNNFNLANSNAGGSSQPNVPPGTTAPQKLSAIVGTVVSTDVTEGSLHHAYFNLINPSAGETLNWNVLMSQLESGLLGSNDAKGFQFSSFVEYTENLPTCGNVLYTINGCLDPNNMAYWGYPDPVSGLFEDCDDVEIPAAVQLNPNIATWAPGDCCPDCINIAGDDITYSTQPLTLNAQATDPTTIGGMDGYIDVTIVDQGFDATGVPLGLPTGNANYTYVLQNQNAADTMLNQAAGKSVSSGAVPKTSFTFGYLVPGSNVNNGLLQTGATGTTALALSDAQGYVPGGSDVTATAISSEGLREGCYNVYVFDTGDNDRVVCLGQTTVCLTDPAPIIGCMDSGALNIDPLANIADNTTCHYCRQSDGELTYGNGVIVAPISSGGTFTVTSATDSDDLNGEIVITGLSPTATFQAYINDVVSGATSTQNADYKVELHRWDDQSPTGNSAFGTLSGFNTNTTQIGSTITTVGTGWNTTLNTAYLTAGLIYGRYSIKFYISDPDATVEIEECYEILDVIVPVLACEDVSGAFATTSDSVVISDSNLWVHDPSVCPNNFCCDAPLFFPATGYDLCTNFVYEASINCSPLATTAVIQLQFFNAGTTWIDVGAPIILPNATFYQTAGIYNIGNYFQTYGSGDYRIELTSYYVTNGVPYSDICIITSAVVDIQLPTYGCTESLALNYDPLALCDDSSCIWPIYGCTDNDPLTNGGIALNYDPLANTDDGSCIYCVYGCTDPTAANYDPWATCDDGSCNWIGCGCTNPIALNYGYNAAGVLIGYPPPCDDGSCIVCDDPPMTYVYTTTTATTTLIASGSGGFYCQSNSDGCIHLTVSSATCLTGQWEVVTCTTFCGLSQSFTNWIAPANYNFDVQYNFCNMPAGCYTFTILDCNGCEMVFDICIPTQGSDCGCTDPAATNYNPSAIYDDGSCEYCGCTDENAINYSPGATTNCVPDTCIYPSLTPPCIPTGIDQTLRRLSLCIAENGFDYYNKLVTGQSDDCSIMNVWKLILMDYLLNKRGLDCIYNCADANTPDASDAYITCWRLWSNGGPSTGLNDPVQTAINLANSTKQGTHSTVAMFTTGSLTPGDVIKHHISKRIWIFYGPGQNGPPTPVSVAGLDPENASGSISGYWGYCNDDMRYISNENNINYIDNFINFANKFCRNCDNDPTGLTGSASNIAIPVLRIGEGIDDIDGIDI